MQLRIGQIPRNLSETKSPKIRGFLCPFGECVCLNMRILNLLFEEEFAVSDVPQNTTFNIRAILKAKGEQQTSQKLA